MNPTTIIFHLQSGGLVLVPLESGGRADYMEIHPYDFLFFACLYRLSHRPPLPIKTIQLQLVISTIIKCFPN